MQGEFKFYVQVPTLQVRLITKWFRVRKCQLNLNSEQKHYV